MTLPRVRDVDPALGAPQTGSMRIIDDDEVDLNEKPENPRYIKRPNGNEARSTGSVGKLNITPRIALG